MSPKPKNNPLLRALIRGLTPRPPLTRTEWGMKNVYIDGARLVPYPYQPGIWDAFGDRRLDVFSLKKSARTGYTLGMLIDTGYHIDYEPCKQTIVQPTVEEAQGFSKDDLQEFIDNTPCLKDKIFDVKSRDKNNTILRKTYPGGLLDMIGANAPTGFRRRTRKRFKFDEVSAYPAGGAGIEGDQILLGIRRIMTFWDGFAGLGSTPTVKGDRIDTYFELGDQRRFFVPCPICGHMQFLKWAGIKWPKDNPERAYYECEHCKKEIDEKQKFAMISAGEWRATVEPKKRRYGSAHIWAAYSFLPKAAWGILAEEFLEAKRDPDPEKLKLKTFVNTILGDNWETKGDRVDDKVLIERAEHYKAEAPDGVMVINAAVDVQKDRLEVEVVGWGLQYESWSLDYIVLKSNDRNKPYRPARAECESWEKLDEVLAREYERSDGVKLHIAAVGLDTGYGFDACIEYIRSRRFLNIYALKGSSTRGAPLVGRPTTKTKRKGKLGFNLYPVGTDAAKDAIFARLEVEEPGPGYCHFPEDRDENYFDQLTAEERVTLYSKGVPYHAYRLKKGKLRNEALDLRVYAYVALRILNVQWDKLAGNLEKRATRAAKKHDEAAFEAKRKEILARKRRKKRGGFVSKWKR